MKQGRKCSIYTQSRRGQDNCNASIDTTEEYVSRATLCTPQSSTVLTLAPVSQDNSFPEIEEFPCTDSNKYCADNKRDKKLSPISNPITTGSTTVTKNAAMEAVRAILSNGNANKIMETYPGELPVKVYSIKVTFFWSLIIFDAILSKLSRRKFNDCLNISES